MGSMPADGIAIAPGTWMLNVRNDRPDDLHRLCIAGPRQTLSVPLPTPPGATLFRVTVAGRPIRVALGDDPAGVMIDVQREPAWRRLMPLRPDRVLAAIAVPAGEAVLSPLAYRPQTGGRQTWRRWRRSLRVMNDLGLLTASPAVPPVAAEAPAAVEARVGAHLHLFYPDLWPECAATLAHLPPGSPLHVTGPELPPAVAEAVRAAFPAAVLHPVENVGHDVWPFVKLLGEGVFDGLDAVLKLHAKKSQHPKLLPCVGVLWRRAAFGDLAGSPAVVAAAAARFAEAPDLGMLGPARLRVPNDRYGETAAWGGNRAQALAVAGRLGLDADAMQLDYFAGTMFWVRPAMLAPLRAAGLRATDFAPGGLATDGSLSHALERLLPALVKATGGRVEDLPPGT